MKKSNILIVGAGPSGLTMATELYRRGIDCRIIEAKTERNYLSKAMALHAGTLSVLAATLGADFVNLLISRGRIVSRINFHLENRLLSPLNFSHLPSDYPFVLLIEQSHLEEVFENELIRLGGQIERGVRLQEIKHRHDGLEAKIFESESYLYDFIIGCDGAHSIVRASSPIKFAPVSYEGTFTLADVRVRSDLLNGEIHNIISKNGFLGLFPQKEEPYCRVVYVLKDSDRLKNINIELFQKELNEIKKEGLEVSDPKWITRFKVHKAVADKFQFGNIFLVGDAAHIHSPIGGQGMNLGIQDALNLSFKFAQYTLGLNNFSNFTNERRPIAFATIKTTDWITQLGLKDSVLKKTIRELGLPMVLKNPYLKSRIVQSMAQLQSANDELLRQRESHPKNTKSKSLK